MTAELVRFEDVDLSVRPDSDHEWLLSNTEVAEAMGTTEGALRELKRSRATELVESKHWVSVRNPDGTSGNPNRTMWTKRGVVRLGFWVRSERAVRFRDFAEELVLDATSPERPLPRSYKEALRELLTQVEATEVAVAQRDALAPSAAAYEHLVAESDRDYTIREAGQILYRSGVETGQNRLFQQLRELCWVDRRNVPYQRHVEAGRLVQRLRPYTHPRTGKTETSAQPLVTVKGLRDLHRLLNGNRPLVMDTQLRLIAGVS